MALLVENWQQFVDNAQYVHNAQYVYNMVHSVPKLNKIYHPFKLTSKHGQSKEKG